MLIHNIQGAQLQSFRSTILLSWASRYSESKEISANAVEWHGFRFIGKSSGYDDDVLNVSINMTKISRTDEAQDLPWKGLSVNNCIFAERQGTVWALQYSTRYRCLILQKLCIRLLRSTNLGLSSAPDGYTEVERRVRNVVFRSCQLSINTACDGKQHRSTRR